ncbi:DUF4199 domain-containing protein [Tamlana sp. I1]|uniref:DUF4199 domain-containing protein n=1 Tax=Tamlana sp. I1 TaxID=2762061 RepID=UPI0018902664|nr:DUF4199 domain-containing protein [Tamlana sp. I1]
MEKSLKSVAVNFGLYLGITLALITVLAYAINLDLYTQIWFGLTILGIIIVAGIVSAVKAKKANGGFLSFKNTFTAYFITVLIGIVISAIVSIIVFNFVDPEASNELQEKIVNTQIDRLKGFNVPAEAIEETVEKLEAQGNMYSISNVAQSIVWQLLGFSVIGLIVAAAIKKNKPEAE